MRFPFRRPNRAGALAAALLLAGARSGSAALADPPPVALPSKPIRLVSPFNPGGAIDVLNRVIAEKLSQSLGQTVYADSIPGANAIPAGVAHGPAGDAMQRFAECGNFIAA